MGVPLYDLDPVELLKIKKNLEKSSQRKYLVLISAIILLSVAQLAGPYIFVLFLVLAIGGILWSLSLEWGLEAKIKSKHQITSGNINEIIDKIFEAKNAEKAKNYEKAISIWEPLGVLSKAAELRTLMNKQGAVKVSQKVVHGDEITKTEIKDSVISKSNVGGNSKAEGLREAKSLFEEGLIDESEYKQMKKEILGK